MDEENIGFFPTWAAFNSSVTDLVDSICQGMLLYPGSPTDWTNLYSNFYNVAVTGNKKTIITLALQLYSKAMQLQEKNDINEESIFRLGELHFVFTMLKCIGKYIEESGLDCLFVEAGLYGESTLSQILDRKHMKRAMEAHLTMYLALYCVYLRAFILKVHKLPTEAIKSEINLFIDAVKQKMILNTIKIT